MLRHKNPRVWAAYQTANTAPNSELGYKDGNEVLDIGKYLFLLTQSSTWI